MRSKIFSYLLVAGLTVLVCSAVLEPPPRMSPGSIFEVPLGGGFKSGSIPQGNFFATYMPWIGLVSAMVGIGEKAFRLIDWLVKKNHA